MNESYTLRYFCAYFQLNLHEKYILCKNDYSNAMN